MPAVAVRTASSVIPSPRRTADDLPRDATEVSAAAGYQRVLHQFVRRELRILADLATWAPAGEAHRTATLTRHADLIGRVLLHHHAAEREAVWPALLRALPAEQTDAVRATLAGWGGHGARIDRMVRDVATLARQ